MKLLSKILVGPKLIVAFSIVAAIGAAIGFVGISVADRIESEAETLYASHLLGISAVKEADIDLVHVQRALANAILAPTTEQRERQLAAAKKDLARLKDHLVVAKGLLVTDEGKAAMAAVEGGFADYERLTQQVATLTEAEMIPDVRESTTTLFGPFADAVRLLDDKLGDVAHSKEAVAKQASADATALYHASRNWMLGLIAGGVALGLAFGWFIARSITRPLAQAVATAERIGSGDLTVDIAVVGRDEPAQLLAALKAMNANLAQVVGQVRGASESIATGSAQIAGGNADLSQRTQQQASALEETSASIEQLSSTVRQNADNARQANQLALGASGVAEQGGAVVAQVVETMKGINDSSRQIADIIGTIDGIAFQTNILALNAAVEAARAGEQGRGFAVVASEVRSLAQRSAEAAKEIKGLITASVGRVETGAELVDRAGATMAEIVGSIRRVTDIVGEIASASAEQATGVAQVGDAIGQMDRVTQQNAALVEESAAAAESLKQQADSLVGAVAAFKVQGASPRAAAAAPAAMAVKAIDAAIAPPRAAPAARPPAAVASKAAAASPPVAVERPRAAGGRTGASPKAAEPPPAKVAAMAPAAATGDTAVAEVSLGDEWETF